MPAPGDQHRPTAATTNPFLDRAQHISEYSAAEIATLQSRLEKQLGPEFVSTRPGAGGGKVHYLAAEKAINLANEVFGFNGWSSGIQNVQIDFVDENPTNGKVSLGLSTIVRVTIRDGTFHEDIGYGHIENCKGKAAAFEKAKKEAATDALKRALRNFGNVLGNCLYDKDYLQKVQKIKAQPTRWDVDRLHRHPDFAPVKPQVANNFPVETKPETVQQRQLSAQSGTSFGSIEFDDDFGTNTFDDTDLTFPDVSKLDDMAVVAPGNHGATGPERQPIPRMQSMPLIRPPNLQSPAPVHAPQPPVRMQAPQRPSQNPINAPRPHVPQQNTHSRASMVPPPQPHNTISDTNGNRSNASSATASAGSPTTATSNRQAETAQPSHQTTAGPGDQSAESYVPRMPPPGNPDGFVTGRSADLLNLPTGSKLPGSVLPFNPHAEATSIRRTHGMNPGKSAPVTRSSLQQASLANGPGGNGTVHDQQQHAHAAHHQQPQRPQSPASLPSGATGGGFNGNTTPARTNFVNPSADTNRRIGMPPSGLQNRSAYKPPSAANAGGAAAQPASGAGGLKRPPLNDVSNLQMQQMDGATDVKKAKLDHPEVTGANAGDGAPHGDASAGVQA